MQLAPPAAALIEKLVVANRILFDQGVVDGFGHVSVRHDASAAHFLLARNMVNKSRGEVAYTLVDVDSPVGDSVVEAIAAIDGVLSVRPIPLEAG